MTNARCLLLALAVLPAFFGVRASVAAEAPAANIKSYTFKDIRIAVSNSDVCEANLEDLKQLVEPFSMQFTKTSGEGEHAAEHLSGPITDHTHTVIKQKISGTSIRRVGMGSFKIGETGYDYVMEVAADTANADHHYLYPVILSSSDADCYYTALLDPSDETVAAFKAHVASGAAAEETDLH